jgi:hypothetical protein
MKKKIRTHLYKWLVKYKGGRSRGERLTRVKEEESLHLQPLSMLHYLLTCFSTGEWLTWL